MSDNYIHFMSVGWNAVKFEYKIDQKVFKHLCESANEEQYVKAVEKIREQSKTKIKTPQLFHQELVAIPLPIVDSWIKWVGLDQIVGCHGDQDLVSGKYEGGFKVWESSIDLVNFLSNDTEYIPSIVTSARLGYPGAKILELGAGAALPSIAMLSRLMKEVPEPNFNLHLQDFNWQVVASYSLLNLAINFSRKDFRTFITGCPKIKMFYGDWSTFRRAWDEHKLRKYNLILMSEVLYNTDSYTALHDLMDRVLSKDGLVIIASKCTYFGLSGDVYSWKAHVTREKKFTVVHEIDRDELSIPRCILVMKRKIN